MKKESVSIEDANGNHYAEFIDIIKPEPLRASKGIGSKMLGEGPSFEVGGKKSTGMGAMTPQDVDRLKQGNPGAASKIDDKYQQIRRGINLPLAKKEEPIKENDDSADAIRYGIYSHIGHRPTIIATRSLAR